MTREDLSRRWVRMIERQLKWSFCAILAMLLIVIFANLIR